MIVKLVNKHLSIITTSFLFCFIVSCDDGHSNDNFYIHCHCELNQSINFKILESDIKYISNDISKVVFSDSIRKFIDNCYGIQSSMCKFDFTLNGDIILPVNIWQCTNSYSTNINEPISIYDGRKRTLFRNDTLYIGRMKAYDLNELKVFFKKTGKTPSAKTQ